MTYKLTIALPKGRLGEEAIRLLNTVGLAKEISLKSRKLVFYDDAIRYLWVKPIDVITYVEKGVADIGIIGSDTLMEARADVYEIMDLGFGKCQFAIAGAKDQPLYQQDELLRVATKYPRIAKTYFKDKAQKIDIININGSVELAPLVGLAQVIVDIVETGNTLKANGLVILEEMFDVSAKMIVNRSSYRFKYQDINTLSSQLNTILEARHD